MLFFLKFDQVKLPKALSLPAFGSVLSVSANEYKYEEIKFDHADKEPNIYQTGERKIR